MDERLIYNLILVGLIVALTVVVSFYLYLKIKQAKGIVEKREREMERRMYELAILKELGDRIGYSLNIENIVDIITGSLHQLIKYNAVSSMLIAPEKIVYKTHLEDSVSREFIDDVKKRMVESLAALLDKELKGDQIEELISGAIISEESKDPVRSFFNIPLVIGDKVVGVLNIADTKPGLYKDEETTTILYKITKQASDAVTRLQEVIKTERKKLDAMVASMTEGVVMTDKDYRVLVANPVARQAVGLPDKEEVTIFDFIDNLSGKFDIRGRLEESVKLDKVLVIDEVLIKDRYWQILVSPVKTKSQISEEEILGGVVIFHDVTHDKEVEKLRDDFTSMMVHDLRSPLNGIRMIAELMLGGKLKINKKNEQEHAKLIHESSSNMLSIVNDLLDVAKLEAGKFEITPAQANMKDIILDREKFYKLLAESDKIRLSTVIAKDVGAEIKIDPAKISQVLNNLISNAIKFTSEGGLVTIQCFVRDQGISLIEEAKQEGIKWMLEKDDPKIDKLGKAIVVAITDTGEGISKKDIVKLFNKFSQLANREEKKEKKGTGLGLVIAKGIIEAHKGVVGVASKEGEGSTFYFALPI